MTTPVSADVTVEVTTLESATELEASADSVADAVGAEVRPPSFSEVATHLLPPVWVSEDSVLVVVRASVLDSFRVK